MLDLEYFIRVITDTLRMAKLSLSEGKFKYLIQRTEELIDELKEGE